MVNQCFGSSSSTERGYLILIEWLVL